MVDLLEQIRTVLDELTPLLQGRVVDVEMPRLTVVADASTLQRALASVIGRVVDDTEGAITVRASRQGRAARIEVMGEHPRERSRAALDLPAALAVDLEAIDGRFGGGDTAVVWLTVPLSGTGAPES
jgi:hypothetical protein